MANAKLAKMMVAAGVGVLWGAGQAERRQGPSGAGCCLWSPRCFSIFALWGFGVPLWTQMRGLGLRIAEVKGDGHSHSDSAWPVSGWVGDISCALSPGPGEIWVSWLVCGSLLISVSLSSGLSFFKNILIYLFGCVGSFLRHTGSLVVASKLLVAAYRICRRLPHGVRTVSWGVKF